MMTGIRWYIAALAFGAALTGCGREEGLPLTLASADVDGEFVPVDYELTSDTYKKWLVAQENLKRDAGDADLGLPAERVLLEAGGVPIRVTNVELASRHAEEIAAARSASPVRFVDDRPRPRGNGKGRGKGKGRGRGKN